MLAATQAFGSELRVQLIHFYLHHPGRQADAFLALGADRAVVSLNTKALVETGVLYENQHDTDRRSRVFRVDVERFHELIRALEDYGTGRPNDEVKRSE